MTPTAPPESDSKYDVEFYWDPICPFSWITSRWVANVARLSDLKVDWRFISLRLINSEKDYATEFPEGYEEGHTAGLKMLRVAAAIRNDLGREPLGAVVKAYGESFWDQPKGSGMRDRISKPDHVTQVLTSAGIDVKYVDQLDNSEWDVLIKAEGDMALARSGRDVGTPLISYNPPNGPTFFGPVISSVPSDEDAVKLWDAVTTLSTFDGFAELKRSLRDAPQLNILGGVSADPVQEDWTGGHRAGHLPSDQ